MHRIFISALLSVAVPASSLAGSLAGTILDEGGAGIAGMQVRLWQQTDKGFEATYVIDSQAGGTFSFPAVADGNYKLDARMGPGTAGNYGDRWYDVADPLADGWIKGDADVIAIAADSTFTGYDITLLVMGGLDGNVVDGAGLPLGNLRIRVERAGERRIHHNDVTKPAGDPQFPGQFFMRGMVPATDYRIIVYDPTGTYETQILDGPYEITTATNAVVPAVTLVPSTAVDPYEDNDSATDPGSSSVDPALFRQDPPLPFATTDAFIGPVPDTDWYCFDAIAGDRFLIGVDTFLTIGGVREEHPYSDPVVGMCEHRGTAEGCTAGDFIAHNDDHVLGRPDSSLDIELTYTGTHCVVVSTYPDVAFAGVGQESAGPYDLLIELGNRRPLLATTTGGAATPLPPAVVSIPEGDPLAIDLAFSDPDGDVVTVTLEHLDNLDAPVTDSVFATDIGAGTGAFTWTPSQTAATGSPYVLTFTVADAELTATATVIIEVIGVNLPPSRPVQLAPVEGATVASLSPALRVENSLDLDDDTIVYQFEIVTDDLDATLAASTYDVIEGATGETTWFATPALVENQRYTWRVRAFDGQTDNPYSTWSLPPWKFLVDVANDPPNAPVLVKPDGALTVLVRAPTLEVQNPTDPDDEDIFILFEVAADDAFEFVVAASPAVAIETTASATTWQADPALDWGRTYWARAFARDGRGGVSESSNVQRFDIRSNGPPPTPRFGPPFHEGCEAGVAIGEQLPVVVVVNVVDPDSDPVSLVVEIYDAAANPETEVPLTSASRAQASGATTKFVMDPIDFKANELYVIRAAADDGFMMSDWTECSFSSPGGPAGTDGGCDCGATSPAWLAALLLLWRRRRR